MTCHIVIPCNVIFLPYDVVILEDIPYLKLLKFIEVKLFVT